MECGYSRDLGAALVCSALVVPYICNSVNGSGGVRLYRFMCGG